jgi:hypothetical protein
MLIAAVSPETLIHSLRGYALEEWQTLHYGRNDSNFMPERIEDVPDDWLSSNPKRSAYFDNGLIRQQGPEADYHQNTALSPSEPNIKMVSPDGRFEAVYDYNGNRIVRVEDVGTYNFSPAGGADFSILDKVIGGVGHFFADMLPYYVWGNSPDDPTPWYNRVFG